MRPKSVALLMLAVGCGLVASIGITEVVRNRNAVSYSNGPSQKIYVAQAEVPLGELLTSDVIQLVPWPKDKVPAGALSRAVDVEGRRARTKLYAGEPILESRLLGKGASQQGATALIPKGYRVVPVKVDMVSGGSSLILPGDRVDVLVHVIRDENRGIAETVTRTILQDIKVFAVNDVVDLEREKDANGKSITAKTISLLVTPKQSAMLMQASQLGAVNLVMRSPEDDQQVEPIEVRPGELLGQENKSKREKESLMAGREPSLKETTNGFLNFLNTMKSRTASTGLPPGNADPQSRQTWTVRVLKPDGIDEVQFESEHMTTARNAPFGPWRAVSMPGSAAVTGSTNEEATASPLGELPHEKRDK